MRLSHFASAGAVVVAAGLLGSAAPTVVAADTISALPETYGVRTLLREGTETPFDNLEENGATTLTDDLSYDGGFIASRVDLPTGTVELSVSAEGPNTGGTAFGGFSETLQFEGGAGEVVDFSFAYDGDIEFLHVDEFGDSTEGQTLASSYSAAVFINLFVHEVGTGAGLLDFNTVGAELIGYSWFEVYGQSQGDTSFDDFIVVEDVLSGSFTLEAGKLYEVFATLSISSATNANEMAIYMNFDQTGTFGIDAPNGVTYLSASGVFQDSTGTISTDPGVIPLPAGGVLLVSALGAAAFLRRRKG